MRSRFDNGYPGFRDGIGPPLHVPIDIITVLEFRLSLGGNSIPVLLGNLIAPGASAGEQANHRKE